MPGVGGLDATVLPTIMPKVQSSQCDLVLLVNPVRDSMEDRRVRNVAVGGRERLRRPNPTKKHELLLFHLS